MNPLGNSPHRRLRCERNPPGTPSAGAERHGIDPHFTHR